MLSEGVDKATTYLKENSVEVLKIGREVVFAISRSIFTLFMTLMLGAYLMLTYEKIFAFFRGLAAPSSRGSFDRFVRSLDRGLSGVVRGQLLICLVNGVLSAIGFWIFGLKYWPILSVVAGMMSLIPIFGSILSSIPAVAIGLSQSPATAFGVLAWIVGIHQLEANFLNPKIIGDAAKIHPVLVVFALITGEHFFQLAGALFAVPCMSIAQTIFLHFRETTMGVPNPIASIPPPGAPAGRGVMEAPRLPSIPEVGLPAEGASPSPVSAVTPIPEPAGSRSSEP
jgi:predicted PurR-regulated permease PerM